LVAELRDLWTDNHYNEGSRIRRSVDRWLERRTLGGASALITVSEPLAETLREKYDVPVSVVLNGFDADDLDDLAEPRPASSQTLELLHTGHWLTHRDPSALFKAIQLLGDNGRAVRVRFRGYSGEAERKFLHALAARYGIGDQFEFAELVPHAESLQLQRNADVLLLLTWNNPLEKGVYTGKLFEYVGARRPILAVGLEDGVAADLIRERRLGFASANPEAIADQLSKWLAEKRTNGSLPAPQAADILDLTREAQTRKLEQVLLEVVSRSNAYQVR
jgi:glycosyltransferase involved in cell wall biosynthesis